MSIDVKEDHAQTRVRRHPRCSGASLKAFAADPRFDVVGVITRPARATGRGRKLTPSPVKATALELGLPVIDLKPRSPEFMEALNNLHADIAAVIAYGNILPKNVLDAVPMGWYNLHFSNLPKWRGAAPAQRAIWAATRPPRRRVQGRRGFGRWPDRRFPDHRADRP